ncbi:DUF4271 domain-containing protein [Flagellimonas meishanensis]|uniref:DUF4271 domain-containing protein n=1 Tax=Flagellimonas meishanensis TaxID=2873264 RepID=UPI001CA6F281|nr:DUF4271 domain-containing protein [[Muricauda] meishanensis]
MNWIERPDFSLDWMTISLLLSLLFLAVGKYLFQLRFVNFMVLPFNDKYMALHNKRGELFNGFHVLLTIFQVINLSLFIFLAQKIVLDSVLGSDSATFFFILGGVVAFLAGKYILQKTKAYIFNTQGLVSELLFSKISYLNHSSLVMCMGNILLIYVLKDSKTVIYGTILLIVFINCIGIAKLLKNYQNTLVPNFIYFILYLCALEIAPLVVIGSYLKD